MAPLPLRPSIWAVLLCYQPVEGLTSMISQCWLGTPATLHTTTLNDQLSWHAELYECQLHRLASLWAQNPQAGIFLGNTKLVFTWIGLLAVALPSNTSVTAWVDMVMLMYQTISMLDKLHIQPDRRIHIWILIDSLPHSSFNWTVMLSTSVSCCFS